MRISWSSVVFTGLLAIVLYAAPAWAAQPGGEYFATALPTGLIVQCDPSANRQVITVQGDQDWGLDLTQAFAGQILFTQNRSGYGVVYENGDPANPPRWATARYDPFKDKLT